MIINKVICKTNYEGKYKERIVSMFPCAKIIFVEKDTSDEEIKELAKDCDVAYWNDNVNPNMYEGSNLKWIHLNMAGLNGSTKKEIFDNNIKLTGAAGRSAPTLAEHVFFFALNHVYKINKLMESKKNKEWGWDNINQLQGMYGKTIGIAGLGNTGKAVVIKAKAFGMNIITYDTQELSSETKKDYSITKGYTESNLNDFLAECDFLVLCLRLTDDTYHLINKETMSMMKSDCYIINISRGSIICESDLIESLDNNIIAGAGIDVTEEEPLKKESPIWDNDKILLTPHCTPKMPDINNRCLDILEENVKRYEQDEPLLHQALIKDIYSY